MNREQFLEKWTKHNNELYLEMKNDLHNVFVNENLDRIEKSLALDKKIKEEMQETRKMLKL